MLCECILGLLSVTYHFWVPVTSTSDLVFRIVQSGAYHLSLFEVGIPNLVCECILVLNFISFLYNNMFTYNSINSHTDHLKYKKGIQKKFFDIILFPRIHLVMEECPVPFWVHCDLDL